MYPLIGHKIKIINSKDSSLKYILEIVTDSLLKYLDVEKNFSEIIEYNFKILAENIYLIYWKSKVRNIFTYQVHNIKEKLVLFCEININNTVFSQNFYLLENNIMDKYICGPSAVNNINS